jgi:hypothetical protein
MASGLTAFKETDLSRVFRSARKVGIKVRVDIKRGNEFQVTMIDDDKEANQTAPAANEWHEKLGLE